MGKPKKGKKARADGFNSDEEVDLDPLSNPPSKDIEDDDDIAAAKPTGGKKGKKKKAKDFDWDEDILDEIEAMKIESDKPEKQADKPKEQTEKKEEPAKMNEESKTKQSEPANDLDELEALADEFESDKRGKKGKKGKKKQQKGGELDDLDALVNEIEGPKEEPASKKKSKKAKRKGKQEDDEEDMDDKPDKPDVNDGKEDEDVMEKKPSKEKEDGVDVDVGDEEEEDAGPKIKTAAQKKAEKKERERQKKERQKAEARAKKAKDEARMASAKKEDDAANDSKQLEDKTGDSKATGTEAKVETAASEAKADEPMDTAAEPGGKAEAEQKGGDDDEDEGKDSKKKKKDKKKKGKKEKEEEEKSKRKPGKAQVKAMQEMLKRMKEEEERQKAEEEAKIQAAEEAERQRLEKLRLEQEKKERDKQKKKEKIARLKAEGKYLTDKQKKEKARAEAFLAAMRDQGLIIPSKEEGAEPVRRPPKPGSRRRPKRNKEEEENVETQKEEEVEEEAAKESIEAEEETKEEEKDEVKDAWDDDDDDDDVKDAWDDEDEEEAEEKADVADKGKTKAEVVIKAKDGKDEEDKEEEEDSDEEDESDEDESDEESEEESSEEDEKPETKVKESPEDRIRRRRVEAEKNRTTDDLRSPVVCVLGHVDTGKTKILDKIRRTHVQDGEAGGITQQIGATNIPVEAIQEQTKMCRQFAKNEIKVPALLVIDTPGHESFSNLRSRGSSLCDIAILVVDIMHGLEPQTVESINLLKKRKTPFVVALNKIDRLFEWKSSPHADVSNVIKKQKPNTKIEFDERVTQVITEFAEQGLNAALYYENQDPRTYISLVPTSAHSGDGMGNLIALITEFSQTLLAKRLAFSEELQCTVLEVKSLPGLGTTIDVVLVNGRLREGDTIIVAGQEGPIVTQIRGLLMPEPLRELRVKNPYNHFKKIRASQGVKILAKELEKAVAGTQLLVAEHPDEVDVFRAEVEAALEDTLKSFKLADRGVIVQASTLGSLEALLEFLRTSKIPYAGINIGPVHKRDIMKAMVMLEHDTQYAVILAFDVKVEREAQELADKEGIKIFQADIIYHLFDKFMQYREDLKQKKREEFKHIAVFPCKLRVLPQFIFNSRDPIVVGVSVEAGIVKQGTPICVPSKEFLDIGIVTSVEVNHKVIESARKGQEVCVKIEPLPSEAPKMYGRHFDNSDLLVSKVSRQSIDAVKDWFREDLQKSDWQLMIELKKIFEII
ncbi:eukaryotic translation initiation factor 5B-like isoform X2 [Ptychodera flava]|uniref:eukaryotic translation initiation factor 5B-like isoform X2 n=1 Tax=Ptychodera flava TaxID=63121 RepID=UPI00396AAD07